MVVLSAITLLLNLTVTTSGTVGVKKESGAGGGRPVDGVDGGMSSHAREPPSRIAAASIDTNPGFVELTTAVFTSA